MGFPQAPRFRRRFVSLGLALCAVAFNAFAVDPPARAEVSRARVRLVDVLPDAAPEIAEVDLGPAPAPGGLRVLTRDELVTAITEARGTVPRRLPGVVRITRRVRALDPAALERAIRSAVSLPRGVDLAAVRAPRTLPIPDGWDRLRVELPRTPRRAGPFRTIARLDFSQEGASVAQTAVPVELAISADAATPDVARSSQVRLTVRRGLVEVTVMGVAGGDAWVGDVLPVSLAMSAGRVIRARVTGSGEAELVEAAP